MTNANFIVTVGYSSANWPLQSLVERNQAYEVKRVICVTPKPEFMNVGKALNGAESLFRTLVETDERLSLFFADPKHIASSILGTKWQAIRSIECHEIVECVLTKYVLDGNRCFYFSIFADPPTPVFRVVRPSVDIYPAWRTAIEQDIMLDVRIPSLNFNCDLYEAIKELQNEAQTEQIGYKNEQ